MPVPVTQLEIWKYIVEDYLEMACFLGPEDRHYLIEALARENLSGDEVKALPGFMAGPKLISVCAESPESIWLFNPKRKSIEKYFPS